MKDSTFIKIAHQIAEESKCVSYKVGALLVKNDRIISHGINGTPSGQPNCCDVNVSLSVAFTKKARDKHREFSAKNEIHAELNAILFAARNGISIEGCTLYTTLTPCSDCAKSIANSGIVRVVYDDVYDKNPEDWDQILINQGIKVERL